MCAVRLRFPVKENRTDTDGVRAGDLIKYRPGRGNSSSRIGTTVLCLGWSRKSKTPILLPESYVMTAPFIRHLRPTRFHERLPCSLISSRYWIVSGPSPTRYAAFKCVAGARHSASITRPIMPDLPAGRATPSRPFLLVDIDFPGPHLSSQKFTFHRLLSFRFRLPDGRN